MKAGMMVASLAARSVCPMVVETVHARDENLAANWDERMAGERAAPREWNSAEKRDVMTVDVTAPTKAAATASQTADNLVVQMVLQMAAVTAGWWAC